MGRVVSGLAYGMIAGAVLAGASEMGGFRPDTHKQTSRESQEENQRRAEEKRLRRQAKRQQQIKD